MKRSFTYATRIAVGAAVIALAATGGRRSAARTAELQAAATTPAAATILKPADMASLMPAQVFFRGQSATVQMRNSGGLRFADGMFTLVALVDTSGYSSAIQQRYQAYLITEVPLRLGAGAGGYALAPGAYGVGFIADSHFLLMDLGAHELAQVPSRRDAELRRPTPLQILDGAQGEYRLYGGRNYVTIRRSE